MSGFQTVVCEIHWVPTVEFLDGSGTNVQRVVSFTGQVSREDAISVLTTQNMTPCPYIPNNWVGYSTRGYVARVLVEKLQ